MRNDETCGCCGAPATHWPVGQKWDAYCCQCAACYPDEHKHDEPAVTL